LLNRKKKKLFRLRSPIRIKKKENIMDAYDLEQEEEEEPQLCSNLEFKPKMAVISAKVSSYHYI
jgi:hypothetical protein